MMNVKRIMFCLLLVPALVIGVSSCKDDDDKDDNQYAEKIAGTYTGTIEISEELPDVQDVVITVEKISDNKVNLKMNQTIMVLPINIVKCESDVLYVNDKYTIDATTTVALSKEVLEALVQTAMPDGMPIPPIPVTVKGEFNKSDEALINIDIINPMPPQSVLFHVVYKGTK